MPRPVWIVLFPGFQLLDAAGPIAAFEAASHVVPGAYPLRLGATQPGPVRSSSGVALDAEALPAPSRLGTLLVAGGQGTDAAREDARLIEFLRRAGRHVPRLASVCSGALLLAEAGLLDGKRATTHWCRVAQLKRQYPRVRVEADRIWVRDGRVWTSAGISAGIDLALALIAEDHGPALAREVACELVVYAQRPGGQTQHSRLLDLGPADGRFSELNAWMRERLESKLDVETLAARMKMSPRTFARAYAAETGVTPAKAVERLRVEAARTLIEAGAPSLAAVAERAGFGDIERMRRSFLRLFGTPPSVLRRTRRAPPPARRIEAAQPIGAAARSSGRGA